LLRVLIITVTVVCVILVGSFITYGRLKTYVEKHKVDPLRVEASLDSLYNVLSPIKVERNDSGKGEVRCDRLLFDSKTSLTRVNLEITRCVERSGGEISFGLESVDAKKKIQYVTLGVSDGKRLLRKVVLEKKMK